MPKNPSQFLPSSPPQYLSPSHSYTVTAHRTQAMQNDDDDDICPVCESECTCNKDASPQGTDKQSTLTSSHPLKIKLTVPQSMYARHITPSFQSSNRDTQIGAGNGGHFRETESTSQPLSRAAPMKRKGRSSKVSSLQTSKEKPTQPQSTRGLASRPAAHTKAPRTTKPTNKLISTQASARLLNTSANRTVGSGRGFVLLSTNVPEREDSASDAFPTFISAAESSSGDQSGSSSELTELDSGDDSSIEAEEERHIVAEESFAKEKARVRRELLGEQQDIVQRRDKYNWQIIPRKENARRSLGSVGKRSADSDADDDENENEAEDADEESEADGLQRAKLANHRYSSQSDDDFDAAVFFASLTSDGENSDDGSMADDSAAFELGVQSLEESLQAGLVPLPDSVDSSELLPLVTQDIHGHLIYCGDSRDVQLDIHFQVATAPPTARPSPEREDAGLDPMQVDSDREGDAELEEWDDGICSDSGETTDDMLNEDFVPTVRGVMPVRCPTPPVTSVNPMSTVSTPTETSRRMRKSVFRDSTARQHGSPTPSDIIARMRSKSLSRSLSGSLSGGDPASPNILGGPFFTRIPPMGKFEPASTTLRSVIIDGSKADIPSPFPRIKKSKLVGSSRLHGHSTGLIYRQQRRNTSPALGTQDSNEEGMSALALDSPAAEIIDLNDVLDSTYLDEDQSEVLPSGLSASESDAAVDSHRHLQNLSRWDRIPMDTFRRTQSGILPKSGMSSPAMSLSAPAPGFTYGSAFSSVLRSTSTGTWWDSGSPTSKSKRGSTPRQSLLLALSPIMFPVRDGDKTPTNNSNGRHHSHHNFSPSSQHKIHKDKEKRRKKSKTVDSASVKPVKRLSHIQRSSSLTNVPPLRL